MCFLLNVGTLTLRLQKGITMKTITIIYLLLFAITSEVFASETTQFTVNSKLTDQELTVRLYLPSSYDEKLDKHYPVLLTTVGESREQMLVEQVKWLSHVSFAPIPEVIQVVLPHIDLEHTTDKFGKASGKADKVIADVLVKEVLPALDKKFRTTGFRIVEGFSSFGNFPLYLLRHYSSDFNAFFIFSPALELDESGLVESFSSEWRLSSERQHFVYLSLGTFTGNRPLYEKLTGSLAKFQKNNSLDFVHADLSKDNYLSGPNIGLVKASQALFADLQPKYEQFHQTGREGVKKYFNALSEKYLEQINLANKLVSLSFSYANSKMFSKAISTMQSVVAENESDVLYRIRLAQILIRAGEQERALATLSKAKELAKVSNDEEAISFIGQLAQDLNQ